jgi:hypothetical protein
MRLLISRLRFIESKMWLIDFRIQNLKIKINFFHYVTNLYSKQRIRIQSETT